MRGIKRSKKHEDVVRQLAEVAHPDTKRAIFSSMRDMLCFAATLGFEYELKRPLGSETLEIDGRTFENSDRALDLMFLVALADSKNAELLREENEDQVISTFEQYAEGGLQVITDWLKETPQDAYGDQAILNALQNHGFLPDTRKVTDVGSDVSF